MLRLRAPRNAAIRLHGQLIRGSLRPDRQPLRKKRDMELSEAIKRVWKENFSVYGARKIWHQLNRESIKVARCTVERLMKRMGLHGIVRGRRCKTTVSNPGAVQFLKLENDG